MSNKPRRRALIWLGLGINACALITNFWNLMVLSKLEKKVDARASQVAAVDAIGRRVGTVAEAAENTANLITVFAQSTQTTLNKVAAEMGTIHTSISTLSQVAWAELENDPPVARRPFAPRSHRVTDTSVDLGEGHWIDENADGKFITLEDGTIWKIDPLDTIDTSLWLETSEITVTRATDGSPGYDYLLVNTDDNEKAHARLVSQE